MKRAILGIVRERNEKTPPAWLEKEVARIFPMKRKDARNAVKRLVEQGELVYTFHFGNSYLERSFGRPVKISDRVVLKPSATSYEPNADEIVVSLDHGASFGTGEHPTTRICLEGMDALATRTSIFSGRKRSAMLDIGTGSGVLALASLKMGVDSAVGTDIDPCARQEARNNARANQLESRFTIFEGPLSQLVSSGPDSGFDLIAANLRFPTLCALSDLIAALCRDGGAAVFSGVRPEEFPDLVETYRGLGFEPFWESEENGWSGGAFLKGGTS